jgi:hypothetical protein
MYTAQVIYNCIISFCKIAYRVVNNIYDCSFKTLKKYRLIKKNDTSLKGTLLFQTDSCTNRTNRRKISCFFLRQQRLQIPMRSASQIR